MRNDPEMGRKPVCSQELLELSPHLFPPLNQNLLHKWLLGNVQLPAQHLISHEFHVELSRGLDVKNRKTILLQKQFQGFRVKIIQMLKVHGLGKGAQHLDIESFCIRTSQNQQPS